MGQVKRERQVEEQAPEEDGRLSHPASFRQCIVVFFSFGEIQLDKKRRWKEAVNKFWWETFAKQKGDD